MATKKKVSKKTVLLYDPNEDQFPGCCQIDVVANLDVGEAPPTDPDEYGEWLDEHYNMEQLFPLSTRSAHRLRLAVTNTREQKAEQAHLEKLGFKKLLQFPGHVDQLILWYQPPSGARGRRTRRFPASN